MYVLVCLCAYMCMCMWVSVCFCVCMSLYVCMSLCVLCICGSYSWWLSYACYKLYTWPDFGFVTSGSMSWSGWETPPQTCVQAYRTVLGGSEDTKGRRSLRACSWWPHFVPNPSLIFLLLPGHHEVQFCSSTSYRHLQPYADQSQLTSDKSLWNHEPKTHPPFRPFPQKSFCHSDAEITISTGKTLWLC